MIKIDTAYIAKRIKLAIDKISCEVEPACRQALRDACEREENPTAKFALGVMNDNIDLAGDSGSPPIVSEQTAWQYFFDTVDGGSFAASGSLVCGSAF